MDIEFIEAEHRENVMKLMEICGLDMKEAYELYIDCGYNFEAAVNRNFNPAPQAPQNYPQYAEQYPPVMPNLNLFDPLPILQNQYSEDDDYKYMEYKKFMTKGVPFNKKYPVRKREGFFESIIPKFFKGEQEDPFKKSLQKYIDKRLNLKNTVANLSEVLEWSWKQKYPVLVMVLDFSQEHKEAVKRIFSDQMFIQQVLNQQFKLFGINAFEYVLQQELKIFFNFQRDLNNFIVCRVNNIDEVEIMHRIPVGTPYEQIKKKLKMVKSECIQLQMEQSNMAKQFQQQRRGNFSYKRPRTVKENIKLREDRKIRQQQEEQFFKACQPKKEEVPQTQIDNNKQKNSQKKQEQKQEIRPKEEPKKQEISQQALQKMRQQKFDKMKKYSNGLSFKIRLPSGHNLIISVSGEQKVQYLFDYVSFHPEDIGFNNDRSRQFDIYIGFGGSQRLKGKQSQQLKSLFQDSQVLIVREISE